MSLLKAWWDSLEERDERCFLEYMKEKVMVKREEEKTVTLLLDKIHIKPYFDYKGDTIL